MQLRKSKDFIPKYGQPVHRQMRKYLSADEVLAFPAGTMVMFRKADNSALLCRVVKFGHSRKRKRLQSMRDEGQYFFIRDYPDAVYWKAERRPDEW